MYSIIHYNMFVKHIAVLLLLTTISCGNNAVRYLDGEYHGTKNPNFVLIFHPDSTCFVAHNHFQATCKYRVDHGQITIEYNSAFAMPGNGDIKGDQIIFTDETFVKTTRF